MDRYRLAVCEDDDAIRKELALLCRDILKAEGIEGEISEFSSAVPLKRLLEEEGGRFDLLILDIQMESMTGMELAKSLRQQGNRVSILFVSGCEQYLLEGYEVQPVHFLLKPVCRQALGGLRRNSISRTFDIHLWLSKESIIYCCTRRTYACQYFSEVFEYFSVDVGIL